MRTAAAGAVAAKYLARSNSDVAAVIGAGELAHAQLKALRLVRNIRQAYVWARRPEAAQVFASAWKDSDVEVQVAINVRDATQHADVVITATNSTHALLSKELIRPGTHITAVGSEAKGKQELDVWLLKQAKVVVDNRNQSLEIGELQHVSSQGMDADSMVYAELGELCTGAKLGRENDQEITVFDSSGVSFQDLVVAGYLQRRARLGVEGQYISL